MATFADQQVATSDGESLLLVLGAVCLTAGLVVWMRRRDYRATQEEYQRPPLD